ncbi:MAG: Phosphate ABC transporter, inner membrane subunit PstC [Anaerolinea thermophila]|uniref:Phosphate transport system permease protein n=1 Tax=Anaerolinea thermophila TaxID=167964 RepID=A0A117LH72_9CHLR|nr:MAG: Phosphate ABC transporter, inner membrane subunit PstC [Anaerolinea thermophila]
MFNKLPNNQKKKPAIILFFFYLSVVCAITAIIASILNYLGIITLPISGVLSLITGGVLAVAFGLLAKGFWQGQNWARTSLVSLLLIGLIIILINYLFKFSSAVFAGKQVLTFKEILIYIGQFLLDTLKAGAIPGILFYYLYKADESFSETPTQRHMFDDLIKKFLLGTALSSIFIVVVIFLFTFMESEQAISEIGLKEMLTGTIWRPGSIIGTDEAQFGLVPMIIGSVYSTIGAVILGIPTSIGTAILLAEIVPNFVREIFRTAIELLSGIPSVVYGLFGMVVIAPLIRQIPVEGNTTGFGILNASIILAIMILPTVTNISEDAIRAVPSSYREASYALGATHWQTIKDVVLPAANSGIIAAIILGIGRALGETMALIMVIGNSIAIPTPVNDNPLSIIFSTARTLTGNIAVEINYAAGAHRSALFFTGVLLFVLLLIINRLANRIMKGNPKA